METYNMPLNLAHQQGRKAERLLGSGKYDEAIQCHKKAAELLSAALMTASVPDAKESISLQIQHHLKQQEIIRMKQQQQYEQMQSKLEQEENDGSSEMLPEVSKKQKDPTKLQEEGHDAAQGESSRSSPNGDNEKKHLEAYRTMEECDSLLRILRNRTYFREQALDSVTGPLSAHSQMIKSAVKVAKNDKQVIEELRIRNEILAKHVEMLLKEIEHLNHDKSDQGRRIEFLEQQNRLLTCNLEKLGHNLTHSAAESVDEDTFPVHINPDTLSSFKLPPLEVPKFDFDQLDDED